MSKRSGLGKLLAGVVVGAGLGLLFAPKSGDETRRELKAKLDEFVQHLKEIDPEEVKADFNKKVAEIKEELSDLDKEKVAEIVKQKGQDLKKKAEELVQLAKDKGTPVLKKSAEDVLENVIKVSKDALKKLEEK